MAITRVQTVGGVSSAATATTLTLTIAAGHACTAGNILVLTYSGSTALTSVTDSKGNSWFLDIADTTSPCPALASCSMSEGLGTLVVGDTITCNFASGTPHMFSVEEFSGAKYLMLQGAHLPIPVVKNATSASPSTNNVTTAPGIIGGELIVASWGTASVPTGTAFTPAAGYTALGSQTSTIGLYGEYQMDGGAGATYSPSGIFGSSVVWRGVAARYAVIFDPSLTNAPTTPVLDNFNRANGTLGANWSIADHNFGAGSIVSNKASGAVSNWASGYWNPTTFGPDSEAYVTGIANLGTLFIYLRLSNPNLATLSAYEVVIDTGGNRTAIWTVANDGQLAQISAAGIANGDSGHNSVTGVWIQALGSKLYVWVQYLGQWLLNSWVPLDTTYTSAGYIGWQTFNGATPVTFDDFGGGTLASSRRPFVNFASIRMN